MLTLVVQAGHDLVGILGHDPGANRFSFDYAVGWQSAAGRFPLSPSFDCSGGPGRLPNSTVRKSGNFSRTCCPKARPWTHAAQSAGTTRSNLVGLLIALGKETAGALRVTLLDDRQAVPDAAGADRLREITPAQLSERIRERENLPFSVWDGKVRLCIAGYQDKIAVYEREGRWYLVEGGRLASTEIVKPVPVRPQLASLPANEHMCMQLARRVGLEAAPTRLVHVPDPVLLVRRFDRVEAPEGVRRLHIVDGCQALGLSVAMKYEREYGDGADVAHLRDGVSFPRLFSLIDQSPLPAVDRLGLLRWAIFQVLIGNTDAHGKNVSFFCDERGLRLAPAYDLVCMGALDAGFGDAYAMAYGDAFSEHELNAYEWGHFAYQCRLPFRLVANELGTLAGKVLAAMDALVADSLQQGIPGAVAQRFKEVVLAICARQRVHTPQIARARRADYE